MNDNQDDGVAGAGHEGKGRVWLTAQRSLHAQRSGLFVTDSIAHPARMSPDLAAHIIERYSRPGEWVLDPMCGIGTTVVQATRAARRAIGVEYERRWVRIARANRDLARRDGHHRATHVVHGDARRLRALLPTEAIGHVALVLTSPPYGPGVHGRITNRTADDPIRKADYRYAPTRSDRANLAHTDRRKILTGMTDILTEAAAVLRPGGHVVIVVRPWRDGGVLVDLPEQMIACAQAAGLVVTDRAAALLGRVDEPAGQFVARSSFFQQLNVTRSRAAGEPTQLIAHEDILVAKLEQDGAPALGPASSPLADPRDGDGSHSAADVDARLERVGPSSPHGLGTNLGGARREVLPVVVHRAGSEHTAESRPVQQRRSSWRWRCTGIALALTVAAMTAALPVVGNGRAHSGSSVSDPLAVAVAAFMRPSIPGETRTAGLSAVIPPAGSEPPADVSPATETSGDTDTSAPADVTGLASSAVGQLFIADKYGCTATVVSSTSGRVAITAAHCVYVPDRSPEQVVSVFDALPKGWISPLQLIPGRVGKQAPYGTWDVEQVWVDRRFQETGDPRYDVAFLQLADRDGATIQRAVGSEGIRFDPTADISADNPLPTDDTVRIETPVDGSGAGRPDDNQPTAGGEAVTLLGYPVNEPFDGMSMHRCATPAATTEVLGFYGMACPMGGGSSGGPWLTGFDPATGEGIVVAVNVVKHLDNNMLWGLRLGTLAHDLYTAADTGAAAAASEVVDRADSGRGVTRTHQEAGTGAASATAADTPKVTTQDSRAAG